MALAARVFGRWWGAASRPRRVVYTCLFGYSEQFNDFAYERGGDIDFICFTDDSELQSDFWTFKHVNPGPLDPARASKRIKALPHQFLSDYDWSLYIDNTILLKTPPQHLFDAFLARSPLVCFRHHERNCVYDEAEKVIELGFRMRRNFSARIAGTCPALSVLRHLRNSTVGTIDSKATEMKTENLVRNAVLWK
jgi:hypothetical protein